LTVLIISRDVVIVLTVTIVNLAIGRRTFMPSLLGKTATAVYIVTCVVFLLVNYLGAPSPVTDACVYLALAITVLSALHYIRHAARTINDPSA
jgi:cardiolipin synthase